MTDTTSDTIISIKADLRAAMNGIAAKNLRQSGSAYRLVYGVELPRLREIATAYTPERHLALALWNENIRETRMLAVLLFPHDEFDSNMADLWVGELRRDEADLAGLLVMEQIATSAYATDKAFEWMAEEREIFQLCGFLTATRLIMNGAQLSPRAEAELIDQAEASLGTSYLPLRKAIANTLLRLAQNAPHLEKKIDKLLS